ncbi:MAG: flagellar basal body rod protein FlgB [Chloroflexi bacterium]|nr:flagellar basal body rod protein FlgB [Chloroflexota bacterium]
MTDSLFVDNATRAAKVALDGLSLRQQAISRNLANVDTPGYQATTVKFEDTLKRVFQKDNTLPLKTTSGSHLASQANKVAFGLSNRPGGSFRADQNNVDVDVEMADMSEAGIQYQAVTQLVSKKLLLLKSLAR